MTVTPTQPRHAAAVAVRVGVCALLASVLPLLAGCKIRQGMYDQPKAEPYEASDFFSDGMSARPLVEGTVYRGGLKEDRVFYEGKDGEEFVVRVPLQVTGELLERGHERFEIFCAPCHGRTGYGNGFVVRRGFKQPASFHVDRLRQVADGYFFDVVTRGFGNMPSYAYQIKPEDRWAIVAYVRALQLSQYADVAELPAEWQEQLPGEPQ